MADRDDLVDRGHLDDPGERWAGDRDVPAERMYDLGGRIAALTARPLLLWYRRFGTPPGTTTTWTLPELRRLALRVPADGDGVIGANLVRTISWMALSLAFLGVLIGLSSALDLAGQATAGPSHAASTGLVGLVAFGGCAGAASSFRWTMAGLCEERLDRRIAVTQPGRRPSGPVAWVCFPSNLDLFPAALFAWGVALAYYDMRVADLAAALPPLAG